MAAIVLVVDDEESVCDSLVTLLNHWGFGATGVTSASELLSCNVHWDCSLIDVRMPQMDGLTALQKLRARGVSEPVVLMSGTGDVPTALRAFRLGASDFIEKPFRKELLLQALTRALSGEAEAAKEAADMRHRLRELSEHEREVLHDLVVGDRAIDIALRNHETVRAIELVRSRIFDKMAAPNLYSLVRMAVQLGIAA